MPLWFLGGKWSRSRIIRGNTIRGQLVISSAAQVTPYSLKFHEWCLFLTTTSLGFRLQFLQVVKSDACLKGNDSSLRVINAEAEHRWRGWKTLPTGMELIGSGIRGKRLADDEYSVRCNPHAGYVIQESLTLVSVFTLHRVPTMIRNVVVL
jgi:hypothetical protein